MNKTILMGALAALSIASASAETIYLTGATAFRSVVNKSLYTAFGSNLAASDKSTAADEGAGALLFTNITVNGSTVDLSVKWSGSEAGIRSVASPSTNAVTDSFFDATAVTAIGGSYPKLSLATSRTNARGDIAFSDTWQAVSNFSGRNKADNRTYAALTSHKVGVVPFTFIASRGAGIDNISLSTAFQLAKAGRVPASLLTGNTNDITGGAYFVGRDQFSGTRVTTFVVSKVGYNSVIRQYEPLIQNTYTWVNRTDTNNLVTNLVVGTTTAGSGYTNGVNGWTNTATTSTGLIATIRAYTATVTNSGIVIPPANRGESSGGTIAGWLTNQVATNVSGDAIIGAGGRGTTNMIISYAGVPDVVGNYSKGLVPLKFEGINGRFGITSEYTGSVTNLDSGYTNIISGKYPFWSYEHILWDPTRMSAAASNTVSWLTNQIAGFSSTTTQLAPNIALDDMKVYRTTDGGPILYSTDRSKYR